MKISIGEKFKEIFESFKAFFNSINNSAVSSKDADKANEALDNAFASAYSAGENDFNNAHPNNNIQGGQTKNSKSGTSRRAPTLQSQDISDISREDR